jgi:long-chain acyl-CoA synthetase
MAIERQFEVDVDDAQFAAAHTIADLEQLAAPAGPARRGRPGTIASDDPEPELRFPQWSRTWIVRAIRRTSLATWILPLVRRVVHVEVHGRAHLDHLAAPVIFAANHQSIFDVPAILLALPPRWRTRLAVAMAIEFFDAHFQPALHGRLARLRAGLNYVLAVLFFNAFPLPPRAGAMGRALRYMGTVADTGDSLLIFPEGMRTDVGEINPFRPGVGLLAEQLQVPVVPMRIEGLNRVLHRFERRPHRGRVQVAFGPPLTLSGDDPAALTAQVEAAVRSLLPHVPIPPAPAVRREAP